MESTAVVREKFDFFVGVGLIGNVLVVLSGFFPAETE